MHENKIYLQGNAIFVHENENFDPPPSPPKKKNNNKKMRNEKNFGGRMFIFMHGNIIFMHENVIFIPRFFHA